MNKSFEKENIIASVSGRKVNFSIINDNVNLCMNDETIFFESSDKSFFIPIENISRYGVQTINNFKTAFFGAFLLLLWFHLSNQSIETCSYIFFCDTQVSRNYLDNWGFLLLGLTSLIGGFFYKEKQLYIDSNGQNNILIQVSKKDEAVTEFIETLKQVKQPIHN